MTGTTRSALSTPNRSVSSGRKNLFGLGLILQVIGTIGVLVCFVGMATNIFGSAAEAPTFGNTGFPTWVPWYFLGFLLSGVVSAIGSHLKKVAQVGLTGAGLALDPEQARKDLEPWARAGGGLVKDALDEAGGRRTDRIQVRCRGCQALNDEHDRFCGQCGAKL
jgi:hypothetical protein